MPVRERTSSGNKLSLIVPKGGEAKVKSIQDLKKSDVTRVSLGNPETVPAGRYAKESLTGEGLWDAVTSPRSSPGNRYARCSIT